MRFRIFLLILSFALPPAAFVPLVTAQSTTEAGPLSASDISALLQDKKASHHVVAQIEDRGVSFSLTSEIERQLHDAGANVEVIAAIRKAKVVNITMGAMLINSDSDCTVSINGGAGFDMKAGETRRVATALGDNIVQATSKRDASIWRKVVTVDTSGQKGVLIELAAPQQLPGRTTAGAFAGGTMKTNAADGLLYLWIPAGTFQMGCSPGDSDCFGSERPAHTVTITRGFWIGQNLVTQYAYQKITSKNPAHFHGDRLPVEEVSWDDARAYCIAVGLRLPTEAEWEYAARAGSPASRYTDDPDAIAWYDHNSAQQTHEVGLKQPNAWKLYDILGNTWEWTADWFDGTDGGYYAQSPVQDPRGPATGSTRVLRGGSWEDGTRFIRVSERSGALPTSTDNTIGFRCAGDLP